MHGVIGEVYWGVEGGEGSCGKRYRNGGRCREVCWDEGMRKEKCVGRGVGKCMG